ncbi:MAG: hypothetical protein GKR94_09510 [Gammaproteobacteria bacterium]|nr:hypothetical protein [Gammaproteobacteria bacterium]
MQRIALLKLMSRDHNTRQAPVQRQQPQTFLLGLDQQQFVPSSNLSNGSLWPGVRSSPPAAWRTVTGREAALAPARRVPGVVLEPHPRERDRARIAPHPARRRQAAPGVRQLPRLIHESRTGRMYREGRAPPVRLPATGAEHAAAQRGIVADGYEAHRLLR